MESTVRLTAIEVSVLGFCCYCCDCYRDVQLGRQRSQCTQSLDITALEAIQNLYSTPVPILH